MIYGDMKQISILIITITDMVTNNNIQNTCFNMRRICLFLCLNIEARYGLGQVNRHWQCSNNSNVVVGFELLRLFIPASVHLYTDKPAGDLLWTNLRVVWEYHYSDQWDWSVSANHRPYFLLSSRENWGLSRRLGQSHIWRQHTA